MAWVRGRAALLTIHPGVFPAYVETFGPFRSWLAGVVVLAMEVPVSVMTAALTAS